MAGAVTAAIILRTVITAASARIRALTAPVTALAGILRSATAVVLRTVVTAAAAVRIRVVVVTVVIVVVHK